MTRLNRVLCDHRVRARSYRVAGRVAHCSAHRVAVMTDPRPAARSGLIHPHSSVAMRVRNHRFATMASDADYRAVDVYRDFHASGHRDLHCDAALIRR